MASEAPCAADAVRASTDEGGFISNSRCIVTISSHHGEQELQDRGVMFENPLFVRQPPSRFSVAIINRLKPHQSATRALLDKNACYVSLGVAAIFAVLFILVPILILKTLNDDYPKTQSFALLFVCGILQPLLTASIVSRDSSKRLGRHHSFWKLGIILFTCIIAFRGEKRPLVSSGPETRLPRKPKHGNCSLIENIPKNWARFANKEQGDRQHMLYDTSCDHGMPLVFKYESILLSTVELLFDLVKSYRYGEIIKNNPKCSQLAREMILFSFFTPCQNNCKRSRFICEDQCKDVRTCREFNLPNVDADSIIATYGGPIKSFVEPRFDQATETKTEGDKQKWAEQLVVYALKKINDGYESKCRSKEDIDEDSGASCYFFDGRIYHSKRQPPGTKSTGALNCSMEHMYEIERENKKRTTESSHYKESEGTLSKLTLVDGVILGIGYCYGGLLLFVWRKDLSNADTGSKVPLQHHARTFALSFKSTAYLLFLGIIGCLFGSLVFYESLFGVEQEYGTKYGFQRELHLSWIYFVLGGSAAIAFALGLNNIVHALLNRTGVVMNNTKEPRQNRKGLDKIVCIRWLSVYRNNTRPRAGKWFFAKMLFWECVEIILQTSSLHQFAANKPQSYVLLSSGLQLINMIATPIMFYKSASASADEVSVYNGAILTYDTSIDTMFFVLNLFHLDARDLYEKPFVGTASLIWPVVCVIMRLRTLGRLVLVQYVKKSTYVRPPSQGDSTNPHGSHSRRIMYVSAIFFGAAIFSLVQFVLIVSSSMAINAKCASELGPSLWNGASPKYTFSNGIFGTPTCAYEKIKRIHAHAKQLSSVSKYIGLCTNLAELNLTKNNIINLPRELLVMDGIHVVDLTENPVHSKLVARNMSLTGGIPPFIIRHLNASLEKLDLSNNFLNHVDESIGVFHKLKALNLDNNHLGPKSLSWEIVKLLHLDIFSLNGNMLETDVNWSYEFPKNAYLDEAIGFLKMHFKTSLKRLNVSHNSFQRKHYDSVVQTFPKLVSFDISFNKNVKTSISTPLTGVLNLTQLIFMSIEGNEGIMHIDLDELDEMERRLVNNVTEFRIRNIGLKNLKISDDCKTGACAEKRANCTDVACLVRWGFTRIYPRELIKQIGRTIQTLRIENVIWEGFDTSVLCDFDHLLTFHWKFGKSYTGMEKTALPACVYASGSLSSFELVWTPVVPPPRIKLSPSISAIRFAMNVNVVRGVPFPIIETPINRTFASVEMNAFSEPVPPEYGLFPVLTIGITSRQNESSSISKDWKSFRSLTLNGHTRHDNIVGSASHLTIERAAFIEDTNVTGPLFRVGPQFKCMRLSAQNERRKDFQTKWNVTCTPLDMDTCPDDKVAWKRLNKNPSPCDITNSINCTLATTTSTVLNVFCFAIPYDHLPSVGYGKRTGVRWECFEEHFFETRMECDPEFVVGQNDLAKAVDTEVSECGT
jgi:hypothetical protein